jgi:hypothetical protein
MCGEGDVGFGYENFVNLLLCSGREDSNYTLGGWLKSPPRKLFGKGRLQLHPWRLVEITP